jgi:hypothetical protein
MRNTADVTDGKPVAVLLQSISGVSAINPLVAFYDIHGGKREVLFSFFVPGHHTRLSYSSETLNVSADIFVVYVQSTARKSIQNCQTSPIDFQPYSLNYKVQV